MPWSLKVIILDPNKKYSRKNNIIYENETPILKLNLKNKFIDIEELSAQGVIYMNNFMQIFPESSETIVQEKISEQLDLFG